MLAFAGCAHDPEPKVQGQDAFRTGTVSLEHKTALRLADVRPNQAIVIRKLVDLPPWLSKADYVIVGERHDHPPQHQIQAQILSLWLSLGRRPAVAFEQLSTEQQAAINQFLATAPANAQELGTRVGWKKSGWPPWATYQPIVDVAIKGNLPIVAALFSHKETRQAVEAGFSSLFSEADMRRLNLDKPEDDLVEKAIMEEIAEGHCHLLPKEALTPMVVVQKARDAGMALRLVEAGKDGRGALLVTGNGHARKDLGVARYIRRLQPSARILSIGLLEREDAPPDRGASSASAPASSEVGQNFDLVYFTERLPEDDHCAELQKKFKKR